jgi:hypothetical protein
MSLNTYLIGDVRYQVISTVVVAQRLRGDQVYVYRHGILPADTLPSQIEHLLGMGFVRAHGKASQ